MKTALVTGATGFIGYHLCDRLFKEKYDVIAIGVPFENFPANNKIYFCDLDSIPWQELPNIDVCFHQAANNNTLDNDEQSMIESNVNQTNRLFNNLLSKNCKNFIYASSCSVYGNQPSPYVEEKTEIECLNVYAKSKFLLEKFAQDFSSKNDVACVGLRYSNVYGPKEKHKQKRASMIYQIINKHKNGNDVKLFKYGEQKRDWVFVEDVVEANVLASKSKKTNIYNVGSGNAVSFNEIVQIISNEIGSKIKVEYIDCSIHDAYQNFTQVDLTKSKEINYCPKHSIVYGIRKILEKI